MQCHRSRGLARTRITHKRISFLFFVTVENRCDSKFHRQREKLEVYDLRTSVSKTLDPWATVLGAGQKDHSSEKENGKLKGLGS